MLKNFLARVGKDKTKLREMEEDVKVQQIIEQKQKSSNERELERFLEEERQKRITENLNKFRKQKTRELFTGGELLKSPSIFNHKSTILRQDKNILDNGPHGFMGRGSLF